MLPLKFLTAEEGELVRPTGVERSGSAGRELTCKQNQPAIYGSAAALGYCVYP